MPNTWATIINFPFVDQSSHEYEMKRTSMWCKIISQMVLNKLKVMVSVSPISP